MGAVYTDEVRAHFYSDAHYGKIEQPTCTGEAGSMLCGDAVRYYLKVAGDEVERAKYVSHGCLYSVACADALACITEKKTLKQAAALGVADIEAEVKSLPAEKRHCAVIAVNALRTALKEVGVEAPLLEGAKPVTEKVKQTATLLPLTIQEKHRIAELLDEFIIPELLEQGIVVELIAVDVAKHIVTLRASSTKAKGFIEPILRKHIDASLACVVK